MKRNELLGIAHAMKLQSDIKPMRSGYYLVCGVIECIGTSTYTYKHTQTNKRKMEIKNERMK